MNSVKFFDLEPVSLGQKARRAYYRALRNLLFDREKYRNRVKPMLRWLPYCLPNPGLVWRNGIKLRPVLYHRQWVLQAARRIHEQSLDRLLILCLRPGDVVIDVGAQIGVTVSMAAKCVGPEGQIHAIEPFPPNMPVLQESLRLNGIDNVVCNAVAAGRQCGLLRFKLEAYSGFVQRAGGEEGGAEIPVVTLDEYVKEKGLSKVDFVKIDVDGPDMLVLLGAEELASRPDAPFFCIECSRYWERFGSTFDQAYSFLRSKGYRIAVAHRRDDCFKWLNDLTDLPQNWGKEAGMAFNFCAFKEGWHDHAINALGLASGRATASCERQRYESAVRQALW